MGQWCNGGSGVVIIKIPNTHSAIFSSGVTSSLSTSVVGFNIYTVTATSTTSETVAFYETSADFLVIAGGWRVVGLVVVEVVLVRLLSRRSSGGGASDDSQTLVLVRHLQ
jgi:hypothetical protein